MELSRFQVLTWKYEDLNISAKIPKFLLTQTNTRVNQSVYRATEQISGRQKVISSLLKINVWYGHNKASFFLLINIIAMYIPHYHVKNGVHLSYTDGAFSAQNWAAVNFYRSIKFIYYISVCFYSGRKKLVLGSFFNLEKLRQTFVLISMPGLRRIPGKLPETLR